MSMYILCILHIDLFLCSAVCMHAGRSVGRHLRRYPCLPMYVLCTCVCHVRMFARTHLCIYLCQADLFVDLCM